MPDPTDATVTAAPPAGPEQQAPDRTATLPDQPSAPGAGASPELQASQPQTAMLPEQQQQAGPVALVPQKRSGLGGIVDDFRNAIAGTRGRDVYVNPETGEHFIQHPYLTGKQQWMKIGSEALAGAARGLAYGKGAGNMGQGLLAAVQGQKEDQQKLDNKQDEEAQKSYNDQRDARIEKANAQIQQMQLAEMTLRHSREQVQGTQAQIDFAKDQDKYYSSPEVGGQQLGYFRDASNIQDLEKTHPDIWKAHYQDNSIRVVQEFDPDGKSAGATFYSVPAPRGNDLMPKGTKIRAYVADDDPMKPGHPEYGNPTDNMTRAQWESYETAYGLKAGADAERIAKLNEAGKKAELTGQQAEEAKQKALTEPTVRARNTAEAAEKYALAGKANAEAADTRAGGAALDAPPNAAEASTAEGLATARLEMGKDISTRHAKGEPTAVQRQKWANDYSMAHFGLPYNPTIIREEDHFAKDDKTVAYMNALDRMLGTPAYPGGQLALVEDLARKTGLGETAPLQEVKLAVKKFFGNATYKAFNTALSDTQTGLESLVGNPLMGSAASDMRLKTARDQYGGNPTLSGIIASGQAAREVLTGARDVTTSKNRFLQMRYGSSYAPAQRQAGMVYPGGAAAPAGAGYNPGGGAAPAAQPKPVWSASAWLAQNPGGNVEAAKAQAAAQYDVRP